MKSINIRAIEKAVLKGMMRIASNAENLKNKNITEEIHKAIDEFNEDVEKFQNEDNPQQNSSSESDEE